jgi:2,5-diamino-6-(ribosylamino)-4(3H)-pyrimidinone 5'-phosphate reductase
MARFQASELHRRPYIILNAAMTIDGKITTKSGDSHISSNRDLKQLHKLRSLSDAVMIGIGTQLSDNPLLTVTRVKGRNPIRIVVDSLARTPPHSRLFSSKEGRIVVAVSNKAPGNRVRKLLKAGAEVIRCGANHVDLRALLAKLYAVGIRRLLLEGGGRLNWSMLNCKLVDEIRVTVGPFVVGGEKATTLVEGVGVSKMNRAIRFSLVCTKRNGNELMLTYKVRN